MAKIQEWYQIGDRDNLTVERLLVIIEDMYRDLAIAVNLKPDIYQRPNNGLVSDTFLSNGDININTTTNLVEMLVAHPTSATVTWVTLG